MDKLKGESVDRENKGEVLSPPLLLISGMDSKKRYTFSYFKQSSRKSWKKYYSQQFQKNLSNITFDKDIIVAIDQAKDFIYLYDLFTMETLFKAGLDIGHRSIILTYPPPRTLQVIFSGDRTIVKSVVHDKIEKVIIIHGRDLDILTVFDVGKKELSSREHETGFLVESDYAIFGDYLYYIHRKGENSNELWRVNLWNLEMPREKIPLGKGSSPESVFILPSGDLGVQIHKNEEFQVVKFTSNFEYEKLYTINEEYVFITGERNNLVEFASEGIVLNGKILDLHAKDLGIANMYTLYDGRLIFSDEDSFETYITGVFADDPEIEKSTIAKYTMSVENVYFFEDINILVGSSFLVPSSANMKKLTKSNKIWILNSKTNKNLISDKVKDLEELDTTDVRDVIYMKDNLKWKSYIKCTLEIHTKLPEVISSDLLGVIAKYL